MIKVLKRVVMTFLCSLLTPVFAQEARIELRSTVIGNQEQPKVFYLVPWQQAEIPALSYQPLQSLLSDVFDQVEREEFLRELNYREKIKGISTAE